MVPRMAGSQNLIRRAWRWFLTPPTTATLWKRAAVALWLTPPIMLFPLLLPLLEPSTLPAMLAEYWLVYALFFGLNPFPGMDEIVPMLFLTLTGWALLIVGSAIVLVLCLAWILYGPRDVLPPYVLGLLMGVASGAAMIPYTVIKEANPARLSGTSTGVVNFINFTFSALLGPLFARRLMRHAGEGASADLTAYQATFDLLLWGVGLAILLTFLLRETGPAAARPITVPAENPS